VNVAAIVPVYNGAATIEGCLRSLDRQTLAPDRYEVVVVDDGSTDDSGGIVERFATAARARIRLVRLGVNRGPAAARNAGVAAAGADVLAFTDADCEVATDWLERALERLAAEPEAAAVEGRTDPKGEPSTLTHQMRNEAGGLWMTCNMVYRREPLAEAGGFDERFKLAWLEDSDLALAVQEAGHTIAWDPDVIVHHLVIAEGRRKFWREARKRFYNPLLYRKHRELYVRHLQPVVPGLPRIHLVYMALTIAPFISWAAGLPGLSVLLALPWAVWLRRLAYAYRARDPLSLAQVAVHPFVQTAYVLAGAVKYRTFSLDI